jgi:hypothetical protein
MRRLSYPCCVMVTLALAVALFGLAVQTAPPSLACSSLNPDCVGVSTGSGGHRGGGHSGAGSSHGGPTAPDPCAPETGYSWTACHALGYVGLKMCVPLYEQYSNTLPLAQLNTLLTQNGCPAAASNLPPSPATLAQRAAASFLLPKPSGHRSPSEALLYKGYPFTYVNLWLFYWSDPGTWKTLTATARAGGNWATVTARPVLLTFTPGDGSASVSCPGPGRPWTDADGNARPTRGACGYQYKRVTRGPVTSTQTITWRLTWRGSGSSSGTLTQQTTSTSGQLQVLQIQTVVTR